MIDLGFLGLKQGRGGLAKIKVKKRGTRRRTYLDRVFSQEYFYEN
jgi:hypothetical protein